MKLPDYLRVVAEVVENATNKNDSAEVIRLLEACADTLLEKAKEIRGEEK